MSKLKSAVLYEYLTKVRAIGIFYLIQYLIVAQMELLSKIQLLGSDMNQAKLSRIEGQQISVNDFDLYTIARALNVTVDELFNGEDSPNAAE